MRFGSLKIKRWHVLALLLGFFIILAAFPNGRLFIPLLVTLPYILCYIFLDPLMGSELRASIATLLFMYALVSLLFIPRGWRLVHSGIVIVIFLSLFALIPKESDILLDMIQLPETITINAIIRRTDSQYKFPYRIKVDASVDAPMGAAKEIVEKTMTDAGATFLGFGTFLITNDDNPKDNYASFLFGNDKFKRVEVIFSRLDQSKTRVVIRVNKLFFNSFAGRTDFIGKLMFHLL